MRYLDAFQRAVDCYPEDTALVRADGEPLSYTALDRRTESLAATVNEHAGEGRLATLTLNNEAAIVSMVTGVKRGIGNVQLSFRNSRENLIDMIETSGAAGLLYDDANAGDARAILDETDLDVAIHAGSSESGGDVLDYEAVVTRSDVGTVEVAEAAEYGCFFTSGTVGRPKCCLFDQEQMWLGSTQVIMEMGIDETDAGLMCAPWYHMFGTDAWVLPHLQAGAKLVLQESFDPAEALAMIEEHEITGVPAVPTQLNAMLDALEDESYELSSLEMIRTGGAVVPATLIERVQAEMTQGVFNTYGSTEAGPNMTFAHPSVQDEHPGTIGKESFMWELRVVESVPPHENPDPSAEVEPGGTGEILVRGPGMGTGYVGDPETPAPLIVDGWLRTKDVASVDEDGYLVVIDRVDNMLNSGGENIYPQEVERVLENYPGVNDVAVVGVDDEHWGDLVAAVVSTEDGLSADELDEFCQESDELAGFKRPRRYEITDQELPRTATGTLQRDVVIDQFFEE